MFGSRCVPLFGLGFSTPYCGLSVFFFFFLQKKAWATLSPCVRLVPCPEPLLWGRFGLFTLGFFLLSPRMRLSPLPTAFGRQYMVFRPAFRLSVVLRMRFGNPFFDRHTHYERSAFPQCAPLFFRPSYIALQLPLSPFLRLSPPPSLGCLTSFLRLVIFPPSRRADFFISFATGPVHLLFRYQSTCSLPPAPGLHLPLCDTPFFPAGIMRFGAHGSQPASDPTRNFC